MYSKYPFTLDIHASMSQVSIPVTVGDTARRLYIGLTDGGEPFIIPDGCRAVLTAEKADGTHLLNDCIIEQSGAVIRYDFTAQTASAVGRVGCQVKLYGTNGEILAEPRFTLIVYEGYVDDDIISENEKNTIDAMIIAEQQRVAAEANREAVAKRAEDAADRATEAADRIDESVKGDKAYIAYAYHDETVDGLYYTEWRRGMNYIGVYTGVKAPSKKTDYEWSLFSPSVYVGSGDMPDYADIQIDPDSEDIEYVVVQETGDSEVSVMSQKATTIAINKASGNTQILANALKGTATGEAVRMDDVSPLPHEMAVKVRGKNLLNIGAMLNDALTKDGDVYTLTRGESNRFSKKISVFIPSGSVVCFSAELVEYTGSYRFGLQPRFFYEDGTTGAPCSLNAPDLGFWDDGYHYETIPKNVIGIDLYAEGSDAIGSYAKFKKPQLEYGDAVTAYAPYIEDISAVKVTALGKNLFEKDTSKLEPLSPPLYEGETGTSGHYGFALENLPAGTYTISAVRAREIVIEGVTGRYLNVAKKGGKKYPFPKNVGEKTAVTLDMSEGETLVIFNDYTSLSFGNLERTILTFAEYDIQIEQGSTATDYAPYIEPTEYAVNADGTVDGVTAIHPTTVLITDTEGAVLDVGYNRDINKAFAALESVVNALVGG